MTLSKFQLLVLAFLFSVPWNLIRAQNLDSLLQNKRVYATLSIGELALPKIVCQDSEPDLIRDIFDRRDALGGDMTGIALDSYMDRRTAFEFNLSAAGQKMDLKHLGDYQWDFNWNAVWYGASSMCDSVYNPIADITGDLLGMKGNNVFMFKLNFWFSV